MRPVRARVKITKRLPGIGLATGLALLALSLAGCSALPRPAPAPLETAEAKPAHTRRPTRTPRTAETETLAPRPSETPRPAVSLSATLPFTVLSNTAQPSALPGSPAPSARPPDELDCKLDWQSPPNGALYYPGDRLTVGWNLTNTGTATWDPTDFLFVYVAGKHMSLSEVVHLPTTVAPGESTVLSVPVKAPVNTNDYTMHWALTRGGDAFCRVTLSIRVALP